MVRRCGKTNQLRVIRARVYKPWIIPSNLAHELGEPFNTRMNEMQARNDGSDADKSAIREELSYLVSIMESKFTRDLAY
jgi:hypothetical protein